MSVFGKKKLQKKARKLNSDMKFVGAEEGMKEWKEILSSMYPDSESEETKKSYFTFDNVNSPSHYTQGDIECIDAIQSALSCLNGFEAYLTGNILKYMWRWKSKNGIEDLKKSQWYLNKLIEYKETLEKAKGKRDDGPVLL